MVGVLATNYVQKSSWRAATPNFGYSDRSDWVQFSPLEQHLLRTSLPLPADIPKELCECLGEGLGYAFVLNAEYFVRGSVTADSALPEGLGGFKSRPCGQVLLITLLLI